VKHDFKTGVLAVLILLGCILLASLISAVQLIPTFEYLQQSQRASAVEAEAAMTYSFWSWHFLTFLSPGLFGSPALGNYWGYGNYWEDAVYIGVLPFIIALSTIGLMFRCKKTSQFHRLQPLIVFCWVIIFIAVVLALGKNHVCLYVPL